MLNLQEMGKRLRHYRKDIFHLKQSDIATITNVEVGTVSKWEHGKMEPSFLSILKISQHYGISIEDLFELPLSGQKKIAG